MALNQTTSAGNTHKHHVFPFNINYDLLEPHPDLLKVLPTTNDPNDGAAVLAQVRQDWILDNELNVTVNPNFTGFGDYFESFPDSPASNTDFSRISIKSAGSCQEKNKKSKIFFIVFATMT